MIIKIYELDKPLSQVDCIKKISDLMVENKIATKEYYDGILIREKQASFYIGNYIAIPHAVADYHKYITNNGLIILRTLQPIKWDGNDVYYIIGIAAIGEKQIEVLSNIAVSFSEEQEVLDSLKISTSDLIEKLEWE